MKKLFNLKMVESESVTEYLNELNTLTSLLESIEINFDDEIGALILLSSLPEAWDSLVMAVSNSCETETLKFDNVVSIFLSEEARRKYQGRLRHQEVL